MSSWWKIRYAWLRAREAAKTATACFRRERDPSRAWEEGKDAWHGPLTRDVFVDEEFEGSVVRGTRLLVRVLRKPYEDQVRVGDLVVVRIPGEERLATRRIDALEGHEMISTCPSDETFPLPSGTCWVIGGDGTPGEKRRCTDSRTFGPLSYRSIVGRILYACVDPLDHGPVSHEDRSDAEDAVVLRRELDLDRLLRPVVGNDAVHEPPSKVPKNHPEE